MQRFAISTNKHKLKRRKSRGVLRTLVLLFGALVIAIPFVWMVATSLDRSAVVTAPFPPRFYPKEFSLFPYKVAWTNVKLLRYIANSLIISLGTILFSVSSAFLSGYALSKIRFRGSKWVLILALSTIMIPFESTMVSKYIMFSKLNLLNSYWALFIPALAYPFGTFMAKQFFDQLPTSLREAAKIDGAGEFTIFRKIYLPLSGAVLATMVILQFLASWNDLLWPLLVIQDSDKYNIQIGMAMFAQDKGASPMPAIMMAITTISILPVLLLYLFLQRYIVEGVATSGIKQ